MLLKFVVDKISEACKLDRAGNLNVWYLITFNLCTDLENQDGESNESESPFLQFVKVPISKALNHDPSSDDAQVASSRSLQL